MRFVKMQGCGNDYIYVNGFEETIEDPGADGLILVLPSDCADFRMRMFNADGSEGTMCGNGARCVGRFVHEQGLTDKTEITLETGGGRRPEICVKSKGVQNRAKISEGWQAGFLACRP